MRAAARPPESGPAIMLQSKEGMRVGISSIADTLSQDARFTWRSWRHNPGFSLSAMLLLALGLGTSAALFSVLDRILFRPLPYPESDRLVSTGLMAPLDSNEFMLGADYAQLWRPAPSPFESVTTITAGSTACDLTEDRP